VRLGWSLCLGEAVFQISVLSSSCWHTAISIFCNDSRHCHAKDFILILHGYIGLDCRSQWSIAVACLTAVRNVLGSSRNCHCGPGSILNVESNQNVESKTKNVESQD